MASRSKKVTELDLMTSATADDLLIVVDDVSGTPTTMRLSVGNLLQNSATVSAGQIRLAAAPANSSSTGTKGTIVYDANYLYICVNTDSWKRIALASDF